MAMTPFLGNSGRRHIESPGYDLRQNLAEGPIEGFDAKFKGKIQYSTPGQAGDGTAVLVLLQHLLGKPAALDYLGKLQANNVGPSSSTGKLQPKVSNGELLVANGDVELRFIALSVQ